ncbi:hypothetical protein Halha_2486 [Halobacteroides halobius DSM 5150]|uniref:Uncharacterized protein n=1 Tax=Halobacteroides halobius (strain ATCC 35273 / DSM 5150 / MD-1) TaxID=748449 RepID=L0KCU6_HALHC|nr:hypothetical protein [Halobacteroides halobius]AGB42360.1 hypothetical protein Halha_2486 [Halobacteroides halobius DSM 5150]
MKKTITLVMIGLILLISVSSVRAKSVRRGDIVAVNVSQGTILLKNNKQIQEYNLALNAIIKLNGKDVNLSALKPINSTSFQEAKIKLNQQGKIEVINSFYQVIPIIVERIRVNLIIVKNLNTKIKRVFNLNKDFKLIRNNFLTDQSNIRVGDQGIAILGINNQLKKLVVQHYQTSGIITDINYQKKEITVNVGTRLKPQLKSFSITKRSKLKRGKRLIKFKQLVVNSWIKIEGKKQVKLAIMRKI